MKTWDEMTPLEVYEATQEANRPLQSDEPYCQGFMVHSRNEPLVECWLTFDAPHPHFMAFLPTRNGGR